MINIVATILNGRQVQHQEVVVSVHSTRHKAEEAIKAKAREMLEAGIAPAETTNFTSLNDCDAFLGDDCDVSYRMFEFVEPDKPGIQLDPLREYDDPYAV